MRRAFLFLIMICLYSCSCDDKDIVYSLNEIEKQIIQIENDEQVLFKDQNDQVFSGIYFDKQNLLRDIDENNDESCRVLITETESIRISLEEKNLVIGIAITKTRSGRTSFSINTLNELFSLEESCYGSTDNVQSFLGIYTFENFTFNSVYIFEGCLFDSEIKTIVYNPEVGVQFIEYTNGEYLVLQ